MVELVDTLSSGGSAFAGMGVRVPLWVCFYNVTSSLSLTKNKKMTPQKVAIFHHIKVINQKNSVLELRLHFRLQFGNSEACFGVIVPKRILFQVLLIGIYSV